MNWEYKTLPETRILFVEHPEKVVISGFVIDPLTTVLYFQYIINFKEYCYTKLEYLKQVNEDKYYESLRILENNMIKVKAIRQVMKI